MGKIEEEMERIKKIELRAFSVFYISINFCFFKFLKINLLMTSLMELMTSSTSLNGVG